MAGYVRRAAYATELVGLSNEFTTSYQSNRYQVVNLNAQSKYNGGWDKNGYDRPYFSGNIQLIRIRGYHSGPNPGEELTLKGYADVNGTRMIIEPTTAILEKDVNAITYSAVFLVDAWWIAETDAIYFWMKTASHNFTLNEIEVTWTE